MGRIGKSYPRFQPIQEPQRSDAGEPSSRMTLLGAVLGALAALGLIAYLITR